MGDLWGVALATAIASAAWLYQRAWERQESRIQRYQEVMTRLKHFTVGRLAPDKQNELIDEHHKLWLFAPDDVVRAGEAFLDSVEGNGSSSSDMLGAYVIAMRSDASMKSALLPRFWRTSLTPASFRLRSAKPESLQSKLAP